MLAGPIAPAVALQSHPERGDLKSLVSRAASPVGGIANVAPSIEGRYAGGANDLQCKMSHVREGSLQDSNNIYHTPST